MRRRRKKKNKKRRNIRRKRRKNKGKMRRRKRKRRHRKCKIFVIETLYTKNFLLKFAVCHISACASISIENQRNSDCH